MQTVPIKVSNVWQRIDHKIYSKIILPSFEAANYKNKNLCKGVRLGLIPQTRVRYTVFVARQRYQRGIFALVLKWVFITIRWDTASWCARNSCEQGYSLFLLSVSDHKCLDTSLYFIITNFHTEFKHQVKASHDNNSPACTLYTAFDCLQSIKHVINP